jgi:hypothetical protein
MLEEASIKIFEKASRKMVEEALKMLIKHVGIFLKC